MGLDVYLFDASGLVKGEDESFSMPVYAAIEKAEDQRKAAGHGTMSHADRKVLYDEYERPSLIHPGHLCRRDYLRSSYNSGGFNSVVRNLIGRDWYDVFDPNDTYELLPTKATIGEWRERAVTLLADLRSVQRPLGVETVSAINPFALPPKVNAEEAVQIAQRHLRKSPGGGYSNFEGQFYGDAGLKILAAIPGESLGPCIHLIYERDLSWYVQAAEITVEFIDHAAAMERPCIHWSS